MIRESEDEFRRQEATRFQRIFPPVDQGAQDTLAALFETARASNRILLQWVRYYPFSVGQVLPSSSRSGPTLLQWVGCRGSSPIRKSFPQGPYSRTA